MSRVSRKQLLIAGLALFGLASLPSVTMATNSSGYHWGRTSNPFTLKLGDNVTAAWDSYLATASTDWTASYVLNTTIVAGSTTGATCAPKLGRVEVCNATYGATGWLSLTSFWLNGYHITQATVKLNDTYFSQAQYNTAASRQMEMCRRIGQALGLSNQDTNFTNANLGSCMDYTNNPAGPPSNEHPNSHDFSQLSSIYSHLDTVNTVFNPNPKNLPPMPPAMNQIRLDGPGQWGKLVGGTSNGGGLVSIYELDFGNGWKIITHVTWATQGPSRN